MMKFKLPSCFVGYKVSDLSLEMEFNIKIIALIKGESAERFGYFDIGASGGESF